MTGMLGGNPARQQSAAGGWRDPLVAAGCGLVVIVVLLLAWPWSAMPFDDDWSYGFVVRQLAGTGHIVYHHWGAMPMLPQAWWGALWVKWFGFSFNVLRLSALPWAGGCAAVCYGLGRLAGLSPRSAVFAALLVGLSPLSLPLGDSFMTDVPSTFATLLCLYCLIRGASTGERLAATRGGGGAAIAWIVGGAIVGAVGGANRQSVWIAPLVVLPMLAWRRRREPRVLAASAASWIGVAAVAWLTLRWFDAQRGAVVDPALAADLPIDLRRPVHLLGTAAGALLTLALLVLPALAAVLARWRPRRRGELGVAAATAIAVGLVLMLIWGGRPRPFPWMGNILTPAGVLGEFELPGRPVVLPPVVCEAIALVTVIAAAGAAGVVVTWRIRASRPSPPAAPPAIPMLLGFAGVYFLLLLTRDARDFVFDRYLLPMIPCAAIALLWMAENLEGDRAVRRPARPGGAVAWLLLAVWAGYALASTQEVLALGRARAAAAAQLARAGVARNLLTDGPEFDFWTQLLSTGWIAHPPARGGPAENPPAVRPVCRVIFAPPGGGGGASAVDRSIIEVSYFSLLPPHERHLWVEALYEPATAAAIRSARNVDR